jgi:hypothetical protein
MATLDTIRVLIQDTSLTPIMADADIEAILSIEDNVYRAASACCRAMAAYFAKKVALTIDVIKIANNQKFEHYTALAKFYDQRAREGGGYIGGGSVGTGILLTGVSTSEMDAVIDNTDRVDSVFYVGLNDNLNNPDEELS